MWHSLKIEEVLERLGAGPEGLSEAEARRRLEEYGPNELRERRVNPLLMFLRQFANFLVYILLAATLLSILLGEYVDAALILSIVVLMGFAGFLQEYKAEEAIRALKEMVAPQAKVVRDGRVRVIHARELVPGDVVLLEEGDRVPADIRLLEAEELEVDESPLTGESVPVEKSHLTVLPPQTPIYERSNMVYAGTYVVRGRGRGVVVATGMNTELGKIAASLEEVESERTLLERELDRFGKWIGWLLLALSAVVFVLAVMTGEEVLAAALTAAALAVAAVPEGLPAIATTVLAIGALRMAKANAIVRKLAAIETLGACNVICSDKTGTITRGEMRVRRVFVDGEDIEVGPELKSSGDVLSGSGMDKLVSMCALYSDARVEKVDGRLVIKGSPTETALRELALRAGIGEADEKYPRLRTLPFDRRRKRKSTLHALPDNRVLVLTFGAPELLLERCRWIEVRGDVRPLDSGVREKVIRLIDTYASQGLRTLAAAYRVGDRSLLEADVDEVERDLVLLAVLGISDPPREGVRGAVELAKRAGIRVIMVTGDHEKTARAIAKEVGIDASAAVNGVQLDRMSDEELEDALERVSVFARVTPEHKLRIVRALKRRGYVVAMTGDGVNDAPALKAADVGVAMGIRGTDVAKEVADLVLADDNFVTIVEAVRQGRIIFENVKKPIDYLLTCNFGEVFAVMAAELLNLPLLLTPAQILWINLVTDALPALGLGLEPEEPGIMERPPRGRGEGLISMKRVLAYIGVGALTASLTLYMYLTALPLGVVRARTMAFTLFSVGEIIRALAFRSERLPFFKIGLFSNKFLLLSLAASIALSLAAMYTPLYNLFGLTPLTLSELSLALLYSVIPMIVIEAGKLLLFRSRKA
ncbi:MAG: HAD-IC family P-type ATPase [Thermoproteales archaeon]|nr:HAD-IC family P-type ATPase [Thermoproteales archaeon]